MKTETGKVYLKDIVKSNIKSYDEIYTVVEVDKKGKVINEYAEFSQLSYAREYKRNKIKHLTESGLIEGTVVILDSKNKIVN